jgi:uncharacterized membrane protein YfcA
MSVVVISLLIGLSAGVLSGLFGIGGGVVMVPALVLLLGYTQKTATGTSLGALILPVAALSVLAYHRENHVEVRTSLLLAAGIFAGSYLGARIALDSSDALLRRLFAVLLVAMAVRLVMTAS